PPTPLPARSPCGQCAGAAPRHSRWQDRRLAACWCLLVPSTATAIPRRGQCHRGAPKRHCLSLARGAVGPSAARCFQVSRAVNKTWEAAGCSRGANRARGLRLARPRQQRLAKEQAQASEASSMAQTEPRRKPAKRNNGYLAPFTAQANEVEVCAMI